MSITIFSFYKKSRGKSAETTENNSSRTYKAYRSVTLWLWTPTLSYPE